MNNVIHPNHNTKIWYKYIQRVATRTNRTKTKGVKLARLGRTVYVTHCVGIGFDENNEPFDVDIDILGKVSSLDLANTKVRKRLQNNKVLINEISTTSKYYSMTVEEFIENATLITDHK